MLLRYSTLFMSFDGASENLGIFNELMKSPASNTGDLEIWLHPCNSGIENIEFEEAFELN